MEDIRGRSFHGELFSADASSGAVILLYEAGSTSAYTLKATEHVFITDIVIKGAGSLNIGVFVITNAAGKRVFNMATTAVVLSTAHVFKTPFQCPQGVTPYVIATAGAIEVMIQGFITEG